METGIEPRESRFSGVVRVGLVGEESGSLDPDSNPTFFLGLRRNTRSDVATAAVLEPELRVSETSVISVSLMMRDDGVSVSALASRPNLGGDDTGVLGPLICRVYGVPSLASNV